MLFKLQVYTYGNRLIRKTDANFFFFFFWLKNSKATIFYALKSLDLGTTMN